MKTTTNKKPQLESLRKTTSTKQQVLDTIAKSTPQQLKELVPGENITIDKKTIINNANKILNSGSALDLTDLVTESIINKLGRPVYFIENNLPVLEGPEVQKFKDLIDNSVKKFYLESKISSVGRIETTNLPGYDWLGTGWLFDEDLLITNRHVAEEFIQLNGGRLNYKNFIGKAVASRVDFIAEYKSNEAAEFTLLECLYLASKNEHDVAVFRVKTDDKFSRIPLSILNGEAHEREDIAVIGYPGYDSRVSSVEDMDRIYGKIYDVKRFAPGKISQLYSKEGVIVHDATTVGGCSGSAVMSLETGKAVGLHFAGKEGIGNYCVSSATIRKIINRLPKKNSAVNTPNSQPLQQIGEELITELVPRNCSLEEYTPVQVPSYKISGRLITYASPDSTYSVTKKMFEQAAESILIGIYDFSAEHMVTCIKEAINRGVKVSLMLDIDSEKENEVFKKLKRYGVECVPAPSCASKNVSYFSSSHEKVIVIDGQWTLIQSGNYSDNSIPFNEGDGEVIGRFKTGNRDMGIAIESKPLAKFFTKILRSDMRLEQTGGGEESAPGMILSGEFLTEAPAKRPEILFPSKVFNPDESIKIQPILSPDNYMDEIPKWLKTAKHSIKIEQQYIRVGQKQIDRLLKAINDAKDKAEGEFTVQIIVAPPIKDAAKTLAEVKALKEMGFEVCMLSKKHFVHCHNKLIIIDDKTVLISSQNWSDSAVSKNREAGVIIYDEKITNYYSKIFDADWTMSDEEIEESVSMNIQTNLESFGADPGKYVIVDAGDIQEV